MACGHTSLLAALIMSVYSLVLIRWCCLHCQPMLAAGRLQGVTWLCREEVIVCPAYVHRRISPLLRAVKEQ